MDGSGSAARSPDYAISPYGVRCPRCFADVGQHCKANGKRLPNMTTHAGRQAEAKRINQARGLGNNVVINADYGEDAVRRGDEVVAIAGHELPT